MKHMYKSIDELDMRFVSNTHGPRLVCQCFVNIIANLSKRAIWVRLALVGVSVGKGIDVAVGEGVGVSVDVGVGIGVVVEVGVGVGVPPVSN